MHYCFFSVLAIFVIAVIYIRFLPSNFVFFLIHSLLQIIDGDLSSRDFVQQVTLPCLAILFICFHCQTVNQK